MLPATTCEWCFRRQTLSVQALVQGNPIFIPQDLSGIGNIFGKHY